MLRIAFYKHNVHCGLAYVLSFNMKVLLEAVCVLFSLNCVSPVLMYYIYDDKPMTGFIFPANMVGAYAKSRQPFHKKYLVGNNNQKNMKLVNERAVDSHFQILKTSPVSFADIHNMEKIATKKVRKATEPPQQKKFVEQKNEALPSFKKKPDIKNTEPIKNSEVKDVSKQANDAGLKPNSRHHFDNTNILNKSKTEERAQYTAVPPATNRLIRRQQFFDQNYYQKLVGSSVKGKVLHKANINNEHTYEKAQHTNYMGNDVSQKNFERKTEKSGDSKKRETIEHNIVHQRTNKQNKGANNNYKYYIRDNTSHNYKYSFLGGNYMPTRIGGSDPGVEANGAPYALFYLMNHDNIGETDFFSSAQDKITIEEPLSDVNDKNRVLAAYPEDNFGGNIRPLNPNMKTENYSAFRDR